MDGSRSGRRDAGGIPIDLALVLVVVVVVVAAGAWYTVRTGSLLWLVMALVVGVAVSLAMRPVVRRRRADAEDRRRQVGHDSSWTSGREEDE